MDDFFEQAYQEAVQGETLGSESAEPVDTPQDAPSDTEQPVEQQVEQQSEQQPEQQTETPIQDTPQVTPDKVHIPEVGEFSVDEIKQWQAHYQQQLREMVTQPHVEQPIEQPMQPINPVEQRIAELEQRLADKELEETLANLKQKYADFDETTVLKTAYEKGLTDLEFVYKATRAEKQVDVESIKEQLRAEIMAELTANKAETSTIIASNNVPMQSEKVELQPHELAIAEEFGLTPEEYLQYR